jgi:hypothetical protein
MGLCDIKNAAENRRMTGLLAANGLGSVLKAAIKALKRLKIALVKLLGLGGHRFNFHIAVGYDPHTEIALAARHQKQLIGAGAVACVGSFVQSFFHDHFPL